MAVITVRTELDGGWRGDYCEMRGLAEGIPRGPAPTVSTELEQQLHRELGQALASPVAVLLGADVGSQVRTRIDSQAALLASQLSSGHRRIAGKLTNRLLDEVLYPDRWPPVQWWSTPLGFALARWYRPDESIVVSVRETGELLDLTDEPVTELLDDGGLEPGEEAGTVTLASALAHLSGGPPPSAELYGRVEQARGLVRRLWQRIRRAFYVPPGGDRSPVVLGVVAFGLSWLSLCWVGTIVGIVLGVKAQRRANDLDQDDLVPKVGWITAVAVGVLDILGLIFLGPRRPLNKGFDVVAGRTPTRPSSRQLGQTLWVDIVVVRPAETSLLDW